MFGELQIGFHTVSFLPFLFSGLHVLKLWLQLNKGTPPIEVFAPNILTDSSVICGVSRPEKVVVSAAVTFNYWA